MKGTPGVAVIPAAGSIDMLPGEGATGLPVLSIMLKVIRGTGAPSVLEAKVMVAIGPLPENGLVLMMAILIVPGSDVLAASMAPDTRDSCFTAGVP